MKINKIISGCYSVIQHTESQYRLVRVIGSYDTQEDAERDLHAILFGPKSEREVELAEQQSLIDS